MGDKTLDQLIVETQGKLGDLFTKPKLSEKLLSKPPFRFIHDVVSAITAATGFAQGLYEEELLDGQAIKDKAQKILYLERIIDLVGVCSGGPIDVRPAKIVAGLEPENTNIFLTALGVVCRDNGLDREEAVRRVLAGDKGGEGPAPTKSGGGGGGSGGGRAKQEAAAKDDDEARPKPSESKGYEMEAKAAAKNDLDVPHSRRSVSRVGHRSEMAAKALDEMPSGGMGMINSAVVRPDLTEAIDNCDGGMEKTREMMEKLIQKPKMTEKVLSKPPFRFIFDVVSAITAGTGFADGLYTKPELQDGAAIKDRELKVEYLDLIISLVGTQLNTLVDARSAKIVAGLEAEKTNRFLQLLALAAAEMPDSSRAVQIVKGGEAAPKELGGGGGGGDAPFAATSQEMPSTAPVEAPSRRQSVGESRAVTDDVAEAEEKHSSAPSHEEDQPAGPEAGLAVSGGAEEKRSMRPRTARRRPPPVKDNVKEVEGVGGVTGALSAAMGDETKSTPATVNIMAEGVADESDDEDAGGAAGGALAGMRDMGHGKGGGQGDHHSKLVRDIMEEQAEAEAKGTVGGEEKSDDKKSEGGGIKLGRLKKSGLGAKVGDGRRASTTSVGYSEGDIDKIRATIQLLCRSTHPLGKCMDYVHEDLSMMSSEMEKWQAEYKRKKDQLEEEKRLSEEELQPLRATLVDLEEQVKEQAIKINGIKANVARNDERIKQLLRTVVAS